MRLTARLGDGDRAATVRSSAYRKRWMLGSEGKSLMKSKKRVGLRTLPCWTPAEMGRGDDVMSAI